MEVGVRSAWAAVIQQTRCAAPGQQPSMLCSVAKGPRDSPHPPQWSVSICLTVCRCLLPSGIANGGNRYATVLTYLADTEEGGETVFPNIPAPGGRNDDSFSECARYHLAAKPRKGTCECAAALWRG